VCVCVCERERVVLSDVTKVGDSVQSSTSSGHSREALVIISCISNACHHRYPGFLRKQFKFKALKYELSCHSFPISLCRVSVQCRLYFVKFC
jgi:hypothetical protein